VSAARGPSGTTGRRSTSTPRASTSSGGRSRPAARCSTSRKRSSSSARTRRRPGCSSSSPRCGRRWSLRAADTKQDDDIRRLIPVASAAIADWTDREFTPTTAATRRFQAPGRIVNLSPYDLRTATTVTFDPAGAAVVVASTDYRLQPTHRPDGVYTELRFSDWFALYSTTAPVRLQRGRHPRRLGLRDGAGDGEGGGGDRDPVVAAARHATYAQVDADMRQLQPEAFGTYKLPPASKAMLDPYRRRVV
jgi:hypothetical protein